MQQNIRMLPQSNGLFLQSPLKISTVLVFHILLKHSCRGQAQLISPSQPIVAKVGDDVILPCHLEPTVDVVAMTLEWTKPDLNPMFVFVRRAGQDLVHIKHPSYTDRTSVSVDELKHGNISLKLSKVKPSDAGTYWCYIPKLNKEAFVKLVVASGVISSPVISLAGIDRNSGGVVLQCESKGWYPQPEVSWLDSEGHVLSAGPTETVRGPDGLYTVSSRVTVEKRHNNNFTCRVQQEDINQTRETQIHVPDDFFEFQSSSSASTVGLAVCLSVCILVILVLTFFVWRLNRIKIKRSHRDETDGEKNHRKSNKTGYQPVNEEEKEREQQQHQRTEGQKRREEAENRVTKLKEEQETKKNELKIKQAELQKLHEEKQNNDAELQNLKKELDNKNKEVESLEAILAQYPRLFWGRSKEEDQRKKKEAEKEVETLKNKLEDQERESDTKSKEFKDKEVEVQLLQDEIQKMENNIQTLMKDLESNNTELKDQKQKEEKAEKHLKELRIKYQQLEKNKQAADVTGGDLQTANLQLKRKDDEIEQLKRDVEKLNKEKQKIETERQNLQEQLDTKTEQVGKLEAEVKKITEEKTSVENEQQKLQTELKITRTEHVEMLTEEKQKRENEQQNLKTQLDATIKELTEEKQNTEQLKSEGRSLTDEVNKLTEVKKNVEQQKNDLEVKNKEREKNLEEEMMKRMEAEEQVEKKTETVQDSDNNSGPESDNRPDKSSRPFASPQTTDTQDTSKGEALMNPLTDDTDSASQTSDTGCVFKVTVRECNNVRLKNTSSEDQKLGGWTLQIQINDEEPIDYTFKKLSKLSAGNNVTFWVPGGHHYPPFNLVCGDLKSWRHGDKLKVTLISNTGQIVSIHSF